MEMFIYLLSIFCALLIMCSSFYISVMAWSVYLLNIKAHISTARFNIIRCCQFTLITLHAVVLATLLFSTEPAWCLLGLATAHIVMLFISKLITSKINYRETGLQELKTASQ